MTKTKKIMIVVMVVIAMIAGSLILISKCMKGNITIPITLTKVDRNEQIDSFVNKTIKDMGEDVNFKKIFDEEYKKVISKKEYITMTTNLLVDGYFESIKDEKNNPLKIEEKELDKKEIKELMEKEIESDFNDK